MMRILLDPGLSTMGQLTGIGHQAVGLSTELRKLADVDLVEMKALGAFPKTVRRGIYLGWSNLFSPFSQKDVLHFLNYYVPGVRTSAAKAVTIHDLAGFVVPEYVPATYRRYIRETTRKAVSRADVVLVPSFCTRDELLTWLPGCKAEKIVVSFNGLRDEFFGEEEERPVSEKGPFYFLFVGTLEKRKNLALLIRSFHAAQESGEISAKTKLYLVGREGNGFHEIRDHAHRNNNVELLGHVGDSNLYRLYRNATALVFPSLYEGFGVPLIEAMSVGLPIIASAIPSTRELNIRHGNHMLTFSPSNGDELAARLIEVERNHRRLKEEVDYGDMSVYAFSSVARRHMEAYQNALKGHRK